MIRILDFAAPFGQKAGPGRWNDLDMLEVGNGGMTFDEYGLFIRASYSPCAHRVLPSHAFHYVGYGKESTHSWK